MEENMYFDKVAQLQFIGNEKQPEALDIDLYEVAVPFEFATELRVGDLLQLFKHPSDVNYKPSFWHTNHKLGDQVEYSKFSGHAYEVVGRRWNAGLSYHTEFNFLTVELTWKTGI